MKSGAGLNLVPRVLSLPGEDPGNEVVLACHHLTGADAPACTLALTSLKAAPAPWRGFQNKFLVVCRFLF